MDQVLVRICTQGDINAVVQLEQQWEHENIAYGDFNPMSHEAFLAFLERFPAYFLVVESDGQIIGYIHASVQGNQRAEVIPEQEPYVEIENIYVNRGFRNSGIGGKLLERLFEIARADGIERFLVGTASKDTDKILRFYQSHGFTPWSIKLFK